MKKLIFVLIAGLLTHYANAQMTTALWHDFVESRKKGKTPILPDFSYAGYHFSEKPIPDVSGNKKFSVTDYGAIPNDGISDEKGIQDAIHAAEKNNGGIVFFPAGKYLLVAGTNQKT